MTSEWYVFKLGDRAPAYPHPTREAALTEAKRLARAYRGHRFLVMQATDAVEANDVSVTSLVPFEPPF